MIALGATQGQIEEASHRANASGFIERLMRDGTVIVVAHRLTTVMERDPILAYSGLQSW